MNDGGVEGGGVGMCEVHSLATVGDIKCLLGDPASDVEAFSGEESPSLAERSFLRGGGRFRNVAFSIRSSIAFSASRTELTVAEDSPPSPQGLINLKVEILHSKLEQ